MSMATKALQRKIDDAKDEGWEVAEEHDEKRAVLVKRKTGTALDHLIIFLLVGWWTLALANLVYWAYKHFIDVDERVIYTADVE